MAEKWCIGRPLTRLTDLGPIETNTVYCADRLVCKVDDPANARLIAAAPDMAEALAFILDHIADPARGPRGLYPAFGLDASRAIEMCRAALARARGEPPC